MKKLHLTVAILISSIFYAGTIVAQSTDTTNALPQPVNLVNQPAPNFALKDVNGKTVTLSSLRGKVVVLDFWATWCGPCKDSFPGMQEVVNRYQKDRNVQFLFIDTREKKDNYQTNVPKFLNKNHYTFKVLYDDKGADGVQNKMFRAYRLIGIPTKFVIDRNGIIRAQKLGITPDKSSTYLADEVSGMIDQAKHPVYVRRR